jgi:hypothetical protein
VKTQVLYDAHKQPYFSIELTKNGWLYASWEGEIDENKVIAGANSILEASKITGCAYLVNDNSKLEGSWLNSIDWLIDDFVPKLAKAGNKYIAHVLSPEFITKFSAIELEARLGPNGFELFYDIEKAEDWIRQKIGA